MSVSSAVRDAYSAKAQQYVDLTVGRWPDDEGDTALVERHLVGLPGPVLDLGCGPGHWTDRLRSWGADVAGVDLVPDFVAHARATYPGTAFRLGSMTELDVPDGSAAGVLSWYSTIHLPPEEIDHGLGELRRVLATGGVLVIGFFDSGDDVAELDHKVMTAYRWPVDTLVEHLGAAGFVELERRQHRVADRPDRRYAAVAARAVGGQGEDWSSSPT